MRRKIILSLAVTRPLLGVVVGLFVFAFGAIASGAAVHHALHHDTDSHSGGCAVCSFAKSQVETADGILDICPPAAPLEVAVAPTTNSLPQASSFLLPPGRAPPILSVVS